VRVALPAEPLVPGNYELSLQSQDVAPGERVTYYYFEVVPG
jgi:hypothetical protein